MPYKAHIIGVGSYLPEKVLSNHDLEKMVDTSDEWIVNRTGMKERRIAREDEFTSDMGTQAALRALEHAEISSLEIDFIIVATTTPDYLVPNTACLIQHAIGAKKSSAIDIEAACTGYLYALSIAKAFITSGAYKNVLVIASEKLSSIINYADRSTCILFGDGAAACVVSREPKRKGLLLDSICLGADGQHASLGIMPAGGCRQPPSHDTIDKKLHYMQMSGNEIFKHAVRTMEASCKECLHQAGLQEQDISWLIPHQANQRIIDAIGKRFDHLPHERIYKNIHKYGNTSASSVGIALDELLRSNPILPGDHILLTAFGFGFTWGSAVLTSL